MPLTRTTIALLIERDRCQQDWERLTQLEAKMQSDLTHAQEKSFQLRDELQRFANVDRLKKEAQMHHRVGHSCGGCTSSLTRTPCHVDSSHTSHSLKIKNASNANARTLPNATLHLQKNWRYCAQNLPKTIPMSSLRRWNSVSAIWSPTTFSCESVCHEVVCVTMFDERRMRQH